MWHVTARVREERGLTLIEALLGLILTLVVVGMSLNLLATGQASQERTVARSETVAEVHTSVARLMRELHQASDLDYFTPQIVELNVWAGSGSDSSVVQRVRYDCSQGESCRRFAAPVGEALPSSGVLMITGVTNTDVFSLEPDDLDPTYVEVDVELKVEGAEQPIVVADGTSLPNLLD